ncbi:MAG: TatD family hydrolase, partial [Acidimicrobiales bacterium]
MSAAERVAGAGGGRWLDSHCHVHEDADPDASLGRARAAGVAGLVCVGTDVESSRAAIVLAGRGVAGVALWATAGLHPHHADRAGGEGVEGIEALLAGREGAGRSSGH